MTCKFYYDESEHSRVINESTVFSDNYYDNFVTVFVGWPDDVDCEIKAKYDVLKTKYKERMSKGEFKSTSIKQNQLKYGFASTNKGNKAFVEDFMNLFCDEIYLYYTSGSKLEHLILQVIGNSKNIGTSHFEMDVYSIVKSLNVYKPMSVLKSLLLKRDTFINDLKEFYASKIEENLKKLELKDRENSRFQYLIITLEEIDISFENNWSYKMPFIGFKMFLKESGIKDCELYIDKEGSGKTLRAARDVLSFKVDEVVSADEIRVQISDVLAGIIGKFMKAINKDLSRNRTNDEIIKTHFSEEWFDISNDEFILYKKLAYILIDSNNYWYKTYSSIYSDDILCLTSLLNYVNSFDTIDQFLSVEKKRHSENVFGLFYIKMEKKFEQNSYGLDVIEHNEGDDFFYNKHGAKIFYNADEQPQLLIDKNVTFYVLNVGLSSNDIPTITVYEDGHVKCYRINLEYIEWVNTCIGMSFVEMNVFPAMCEFSVEDGIYYVDIID